MLSDSSAMNLYIAAIDYSYIGEYNKALVAFDKAEATETAIAQKKSDAATGYSTKPAVKYIIDRSEKEQLIIINEAHHQPLHRIFTESLLEGLYARGFRYFGLETLAEDSLINIRKWPLQSDGYYTREPQYANMVRKALKLGFIVFGYESDGNGKAREIGQAKNIQKVLLKDSGAKILIHCGFNHVIEGKHPNWGKAMAGELKSLSGINPFTIDQVDLSEHSLPIYESPYYKPELINSSVALFDKYPGSDSLLTDVKIMHPRIGYISGRPNLLLRNNTWKLYDLKAIKFTGKFPYQVAAYNLGEGKNGVPVDLIEINNATEKPLILPTGQFELQVKDRAGKKQKTTLIVD